MNVLEWLKVLLIGIVEGITEWLPISSTGHMILIDEFVKLNVQEDFMELFLVVIQLGAILAIVTLYWKKLWPFTTPSKGWIKPRTWVLWFHVIIGCLPAAIIGLLLDDWMDEHFYNAPTVAATLIIYGILFIVLETFVFKKRKSKIRKLSQISYPTALLIGCFQILALIPGTSRSGATILGAMLLGASRGAAAEFSFYLAIPVMAGASLLKLIKFGRVPTGTEIAILIVGMIVAYVVSIAAVRTFIGYIKKKDFRFFGWYRIVLGLIVILIFSIRALMAA